MFLSYKKHKHGSWTIAAFAGVYGLKRTNPIFKVFNFFVNGFKVSDFQQNFPQQQIGLVSQLGVVDLKCDIDLVFAGQTRHTLNLIKYRLRKVEHLYESYKICFFKC